MRLAEIIRNYREQNNISQRQLAANCDLSTGYISLIEKEYNPQTGKRMIPSLPVINKLAHGMGMTIDELLSICDDMPVNMSSNTLLSEESNQVTVNNIIKIPDTKDIPLIGLIACGKPILAEENIEYYIKADTTIPADFALKCCGDSMINARIFDGDIVYIRQQPDVDNGEIAAVLIGNEATLKRVHKFPSKIVLSPCNPMYEDLVYSNEQLDDIRILGKAVAFTSIIR